jgi:hypothetical protein
MFIYKIFLCCTCLTFKAGPPYRNWMIPTSWPQGLVDTQEVSPFLPPQYCSLYFLSTLLPLP